MKKSAQSFVKFLLPITAIIIAMAAVSLFAVKYIKQDARHHTIISIFTSDGEITPQGNVEVKHGESMEFTILPSDGFTALVTVDGNPQGDISSYKFTDITADHTIVATFKKSSTLTSDAPPPNDSEAKEEESDTSETESEEVKAEESNSDTTKTPSSEADEAYVIHKIAQGDTLWDLASKYSTTVEEIQKANESQDFSNVLIGTEIRIPQKQKSA